MSFIGSGRRPPPAAIYERIREVGLLRAVGASQRQVHAMVRWEAIISWLGATLGLGSTGPRLHCP